MPSKTKDDMQAVGEELKNILNCGSQILKSVNELDHVASNLKLLDKSDISAIAKKYGKDVLKLSRGGLSQISGKDLKEGEVKMILKGCLAGLDIVVSFSSISSSLFGEMEIEKCIYHLVAKSCELKLTNVVKAGLKLLMCVLGRNEEPIFEDEEGKLFMDFPNPSKGMSSELLRLVTGVLINAISSMVSTKDTAVMETSFLIEHCCLWIRKMLEGKDAKGTDYIDRLQRTLPFLASLVDEGNQQALTGSYKQLMHLKWDYSEKLTTSQILSEVHTVGVHAQKANLMSEMLECYDLLFKLALAESDSPVARPCPWSIESLEVFLKCLSQFNTLCVNCELQIEKSIPLIESVILKLLLDVKHDDSVELMSSKTQQLVLCMLKFQCYNSLSKDKQLKDSVIYFQKTSTDSKSKKKKGSSDGKADVCSRMSMYFEESMLSLETFIQTIDEGDEGGSITDNEHGLCVSCWRSLVNIPSSVISENESDMNKFEHILDIFSQFTFKLVERFKTLKMLKSPSENELGCLNELKKIASHLNNSVVESLTKAVSIRCDRLMKAESAEEEGTIEMNGETSSLSKDNVIVASNELITTWMKRAQACTSSSAQIKRIAFAYSLHSKTLSCSSKYQFESLLPLCRACNILDQFVSLTIKQAGSQKDVSSSSSSSDTVVKVFEESKLLSRLVSLSNTLIDLNDKEHAAIVLRYAIMKCLEIYSCLTPTCIDLIHQFVKVQFILLQSSSNANQTLDDVNSRVKSDDKLSHFHFMKKTADDVQSGSKTQPVMFLSLYSKLRQVVKSSNSASASSESLFPLSLQIDVLMLELKAQAQVFFKSSAFKFDGNEMNKLLNYHEYLVEKISHLFAKHKVDSSSEVCEIKVYSALVESMKFLEQFYLCTKPRQYLSQFLKQQQIGHKAEKVAKEDKNTSSFLVDEKIVLKIAKERMEKCLLYFHRLFTDMKVKLKTFSSSPVSTSFHHAPSAVCLETAVAYLHAHSLESLFLMLSKKDVESGEENVDSDEESDDGGSTSTVSRFEDTLLNQKLGIALECCDVLLSHSLPSSSAHKCQACAGGASKHGKNNLSLQSLSRLDQILAELSDCFTSIGNVLHQVKCHHFRSIVYELSLNMKSESEKRDNDKNSLPILTSNLSINSLLSAQDVSRHLKGSNAAIFPMRALCAQSSNSMLTSIQSSTKKDGKKCLHDDEHMITDILAKVILQLEQDSKPELSSSNHQQLFDASPAKSLTDMDARTHYLAKVTTSDIYLKHLDFDEQMLVLKEVASYCGGRTGGLFSQIPSPSSTMKVSESSEELYLHDNDGMSSSGNGDDVKTSLVPLNSASLWWIHRYVHVLLSIADNFASTGKPNKSMQYIECALRLSTELKSMHRTCLVHKLNLLVKLNKNSSELESVISLLHCDEIEPVSSDSKQPIIAGEVFNGLSAMQSCLLLLIRGDMERKLGESEQHDDDQVRQEKFERALLFYEQAENLTDCTLHSNFINPLMSLLEENESKSDDVVKLSSNHRKEAALVAKKTGGVRSSGKKDDDAFTTRIVAMKLDIKWRKALTLSFLDTTEKKEKESLKLYKEITAVESSSVESPPSLSFAQAMAHYQIAEIYAKHVTSRPFNSEFESESEYSDSSLSSEKVFLSIKKHLGRAYGYAAFFPHSKLYRDILRSFASFPTCHFNGGKNKLQNVSKREFILSDDEKCWSLFRSIGCSASQQLMSKFSSKERNLNNNFEEAQENENENENILSDKIFDTLSSLGKGFKKDKEGNLTSLPSLQANSLFHQNYPSTMVTCGLCLNSQGYLSIARLEANQPAMIRQLPEKFPQEIMSEFDDIINRNRAQLQQFSGVDASRLDKDQKNGWWRQRDELDSQLLALINQLEQYLGPWKYMFNTGFDSSNSEKSWIEINKRIMSDPILNKNKSVPSHSLDMYIDFELLKLCFCSRFHANSFAEISDIVSMTFNPCLFSEICEKEQLVNDMVHIREHGVGGSSELDEGIESANEQADSFEENSPKLAAEEEEEDDDDEKVDMKELSKLKVSDLKDQLNSLNESTKGLKKELVERLFVAKNKKIKNKSVKTKQSSPIASLTASVNKLSISDEVSTSSSFVSTRPPQVKDRMETKPLVLVLDETLQRFPFESLNCLKVSNKEISRMPSLSFMLAQSMVLREEALQNKGSDGSDEGSPISKVSYIVDPENNLSRTQATLKPIFHSLKQKFGDWNGFVGKAPSEKQFRSMLVGDSDLVVYCGHGSGERILSRENVEALSFYKRGINGLESETAKPFHAVLMGCSSGYLHLYGEYEPNGFAQAMLLSGTTCLVANLWDVTDKDIDKFTEKLLHTWTTATNNQAKKKDTLYIEEVGKKQVAATAGEGADGKSLSEAVSESRSVCKMQGLSACAPVCYGLSIKCFFA